MSELNVVENFKNLLSQRDNATAQVAFQFGDVEVRKLSDKRAVIIDGSEYTLSDSAVRQLANDLGIPIPFSSKIDDELFNYIFNYLLRQNKEEFKTALANDGNIRAFSSGDYAYVPTSEVFNVLESTFDGDYDLKYIKLDDSVMSFTMLPHEYRNAIDGAKLFGGIKVAYSDAWNVFPTLDAYIWREICTNGMIDKYDDHKFRVSGKTQDQILTQFGAFAQGAFERIPMLYDNFEKLLEESVTDYKAMIKRICVEYKLSNKIRERLLYWAEQPEFLATISGGEITNMHDIVNLITWAGSNDFELSMDNRNLLMSIGGNLTLSHSERCGSCGIVLAG